MIKNSKRLIIFTLIFIILIIAPIGLNQYYKYSLQPVSKSESPQIFVVKPGQSVTQIAKNLENNKLIRSSLAFKLLISQMGIAKNIQAGDFRLSSHLSAREIAIELTHGAIDVWITIPEGLRVEEIASRLEEKLKFGENDKFQFGKKEFIQLSEEGYMFPDTYLIPKDVTATDAVARLRETFNQKVDESLLNLGQKNNLSPKEIIILASLIEREAKTNQERPVIAGILVNRLEAGLPLQVDATVQYAKGYDASKNSWWGSVTPGDYKSVRSVYNTYVFAGLPPDPIASPGLESIQAAAQPQESGYYYYIHDSEGKIHYAETIEEHNRNIQEFL